MKVYTDIGATFDSERVYRYRLWRAWGAGARVAFVMLNPSTADETVLDPTLRRCEDYAERWGFSGFEVANLFALRSTDPDGLLPHPDPVGDPANLLAIEDVAKRCQLVMAGWGRVRPKLRYRIAPVLKVLTQLCDVHALKVNDDGTPAHPLYLAKAREPFLYKE